MQTPHELNGSGFFVAVLEKLAPHAEAAGKLADDTPEVVVADDALVGNFDDAADTATAALTAAASATPTAAEATAEAAADAGAPAAALPSSFIGSPFASRADYEAWRQLPAAEQPAAIAAAVALRERPTILTGPDVEELRRQVMAPGDR